MLNLTDAAKNTCYNVCFTLENRALKLRKSVAERLNTNCRKTHKTDLILQHSE